MLSKKILTSIIIILLLFITIAGVQYFNQYRQVKTQPQDYQIAEVTLDMWGVWDNSDHWKEVIHRFENTEHIWNNQKVKIKINYTKKDYKNYKNDLKYSFEQNSSPNIFMLQDHWLPTYQSQLAPLSTNFSTIKEYELINLANNQEFFDIFSNFTRNSVIMDEQVWALPLYSDNLALYYNKDIFAQAEITPPTTWEELKQVVKKLTVVNRKGEIEKSAIAMGGGSNVNRSCDIVYLLTLQGGGEVINQHRESDLNQTFTIPTPNGEKTSTPGFNAIQFYTDFSNPAKETYTWDGIAENNSIQKFASGEVAMMINYSYQKNNLLALNPDLNYGIAPIPQNLTSSEIQRIKAENPQVNVEFNLSNVWVPVVSQQNSCIIKNNHRQLSCSDMAWSFLSFVNQPENLSIYLESTQKAAARLDIAQQQTQQNNDISVFAKQAATSLVFNKFNDEIDNIITQMLDEIPQNRLHWKDTVDQAVEKIKQLNT